MNLISCNSCGVVLDKDRINEPYITDGEGCIDQEKAMWSRDGYKPAIICPVCRAKIRYEDGE